jgi:hypothetical protein
MTRTFDETNEIFSNLSEEMYKATEIAAKEYYAHGNIDLVVSVSDMTGLTIEEILAWW